VFDIPFPFLMPRILFIAPHRPHRSPSQRFRFEQYLDIFKQNGFECDHSFLISEKDDRYFYQPGNLRTKAYFFFKSAYRRWKNVRHADEYDIIFVQREAFMTGSTWFEKKISRSKAKLVFDFDDAIWHLDISEANKKFSWLKNPGKTAKIISYADLVIAGNRYLADYAKHHSDNVVIIPTTIDTDEYQRLDIPKNNDTITIGWSGSLTTMKHFNYAVPFLKELKEKYGNKIEIKAIGDANYENKELGVKGIAWTKENELKELSSFDIGIMPLPDDEWAKGKCGLKGLQYMALEIPTVMSPVGVNTEIINDGVNGFLAGGVEEWVEKISRLVESKEFHDKMGKEARWTVEERYSVNSQKENYLQLFRELLK
jgi:glycosyltransferase involved in cell wall biosynthesis